MTTVVGVTGGAGLVASNVVRELLSADPRARAVVLDLAPLEGLIREYLAPFDGRVAYHRSDIRDVARLDAIPDAGSITHVVHAAMVAHVPDWERDDPRRFLDANVTGTVNVLEWARRLPRLRRFVYVSSGGVYGEPTRWSTDEPQPEDGPFNPPELYAISKLAAEQTARRYGELFGLDVRTVRLSGVFGPMERPTPGRALMSMPYALCRALCEDRAVRITERTMRAGGDFLSAEDVALAMRRILTAARPEHAVYNIAFGRFTPVEELLDAACTAAPELRVELVGEPAGADVDMDPARRRARWNGYAIDRLRSELGWAPRPLRDQLASYLEWVGEDPDARCPPATTHHDTQGESP